MNKPPDPLLSATVSVAWVVLLNKPFYPLYVWYFIGAGAAQSCLTLLGAPLFLLVIVAAKKSSFHARLLLPVLATVDILAETWLFGQASATELFLLCALMLAASSFYEEERYTRVGVSAAIFLLFVSLHGFFGEPLFPWTDEQLAILRNINIFAVASLATFISMRYPGRISAPPAIR